MRGKHIFIITALISILMLSACEQKMAQLQSLQQQTRPLQRITSKTIERSLRKRHAIRNDGTRRHHKKYKVPDEEVNKEVEKVKTIWRSIQKVLENNGLKDEEDFKNQIKFKLAMNEAIKKSITEKDVKDHYKPEIKASHILVSDENEAKEIKSKLDAGASFEELAKQESQDLLSKDKGGDLGYFNSGTMAPEFETAAYKLNVGQISNPVKSSNGYHVIKLTDKKI